MSDSSKSTTVSFYFSFRQDNYLYDYDKMNTVLSRRLKSMFESKSIAVAEYEMTQWGAAGGAGLLQFIINLYNNNSLIFLAIGKIPILMNIGKKAFRLLYGARQSMARRGWEKYQKRHRFDHYLDIDLRLWVASPETDLDATKQSVLVGLNQMLLLIPEIVKEIEIIYPEFLARFNLTVLPKHDSNYIVSLRDVARHQNYREILLRAINKQPDINFPITVCYRNQRFEWGRKKLEITPNANWLKDLYSLLRNDG